MADVGRITELWRAAADALELPGVVEGTVPSQWLLDEKRRRQRAEAERDRLREQLDAARQQRDEWHGACNRQVSALHDALYEQIPNGAGRDAVNAEIWKCHDILRAVLGVVGEQE